MADSTPQTPKRAREKSEAATQSSLGDLVAALDGGARPAAPAPAPAEARPAVDVLLSAELPLGEDDDLSLIEGEAAPRLVSIVESLLFASSKALGVRDIRAILKDATVRQIQLALKQLGRDLEGRGVILAQAAGGFRLRTNPENGRWVQQLLAERPAKLSRSQLESLAVVAYRQPITKPEMDHIRGVDCSAVLKVLLDYDLVRIVGRKEEPGRPHLYGTTLKFLEFFNLRSLRDMPDLHEFRELTEESRAVVREHLGESALYDEREAMGQEVLDWSGGASDEVEAAPAPEPESPAEADAGAEPESEHDSDVQTEAAPEDEPEDAREAAREDDDEGAAEADDAEADVEQDA